MKNYKIIYLAINLPWAEARRANLAEQSKEHGVDIQIVPAVIGKELTAEQLALYDEKRRHTMYAHDLTPNEKACTLSHRKALMTFVESDADYAVICEDDVTFEPNFNESIDFLITKLTGWECVKLYTEPCKTYPLCKPISGAPVQPVFPKKYPWGAIGYLYSRKGAEHILAHFDRFWLGADVQLATIMLQYGIPSMGVYPNCIGTLYPQNEQSDIDAGESRGQVVRAAKRTALQYMRYRLSVWRMAVNKFLMRVRMRFALRTK